MGWVPPDVVLHKTSLTFDASVWELLLRRGWGRGLCWPSRGLEKDPVALVEVMAEAGVTIVDLVPTVAALVGAVPGLSRCSALRLVVCGGEALPGEVAARLSAVTGAVVHNLYGPAEVTITATSQCRWLMVMVGWCRSVCRCGTRRCWCWMAGCVRCRWVWWVSCICLGCRWRGGMWVGWI